MRNKHDSWLTGMQTVQYWYAYFVMRNIERAFKQVLCTSGCLTAYRRFALLELEPVLAGRALRGVPIKHGEDRFLARSLVKAGYSTTITLEARCRTYVPDRLAPYLSQQLRWRCSNCVDYLGGLTHVWKLHPLIAINYFAKLVVLFGYPLAVAKLLLAGPEDAALDHLRSGCEPPPPPSTDLWRLSWRLCARSRCCVVHVAS